MVNNKKPQEGTIVSKTEQNSDVLGNIFEKSIAQLKELKQVVQTEENYTFKFSRRVPIGFDDSTQKVLYSPVEKAEVTKSKDEINDLFLKETCLTSQEIVEIIEKHENQQVVIAVYKAVVNIVRKNINPFTQQ